MLTSVNTPVTWTQIGYTVPDTKVQLRFHTISYAVALALGLCGYEFMQHFQPHGGARERRVIHKIIAHATIGYITSGKLHAFSI